MSETAGPAAAHPEPRTRPRTQPQASCPICHQAGTLAHAHVADRAHNVPGDWSIRACPVCHIGWLDPQPIDEDIGLCYPGIYYTHQTPRAVRSPIGTGGAQGWVRDRVLAGRYGYGVPGAGSVGRTAGRLLGHIPLVRDRITYTRDHSLPIWRDGGRLLDIGCGAGNYLRTAASLGWRVYGMDPDPMALDVAASSGAEVRLGTLDTVTWPDAPFDAVTTMHSIEHARDPGLFLRQALALLRPGGFFYLQTPNFRSLMHRRYGADWYALEISRHLCLLSVPAIRRLLEETCPWTSLTVRSNPRRAIREQEQTLAMRRTGSFEAMPEFSRRDRLGMAAWAWLEAAGNKPFDWGEEIEVIGIRA
jgi:2-polyprenyl-3-methyl-5-hydroxy-6-metoxy-1,4-benzoquinol methylase